MAIFISGNQPAYADEKNSTSLDAEYESYTINGGKLIADFKDCSIKYDQFSIANYTCLKSVEFSILKNIDTLYSRNKSLYEADPFLSNLYADKRNNYAKLKNACERTFPEPLRKHFNNQILSCKIQIDLNKYFLFANELF